jgi:hypothetical protein
LPSSRIEIPLTLRQAMRIGLNKSRSAGGTEQTAGMLSGHLFGPGGNTTPEDIGSMGGEYGPLRRRHSGKGRAVPGRCPSIPSRSSFRCARPCWTTSRTSGSSRFDTCSRWRARQMPWGLIERSKSVWSRLRVEQQKRNG